MILIIGNYTNSKVIEQRKLPAPNPAASSRMLRIAKSLESNDVKTAIVSSASAASIGFNKKIIDKTFFIEEDGIEIFFSSALTIPFLSFFWELISLPFLFLKMTRSNSVKAVVLYCYYPSALIVGFIAKYKKIKILEDLQDIVTDQNISISDMSILDYLRQKFGKILMKSMLKISDVVIVPTIRFIKFIPKDKKVITISGCFDINDFSTPKELIKGKINILFSGLLNEEQGINLLFSTLSKLNYIPNAFEKYKFTLCGYGFDEIYIKDEIKKLNKLDVEFLGYIDYGEYEKILLRSHICLALQNPEGIFGLLKTPSKAFEYMANGKMVIVSKVGDFSGLPLNTVVLLENYNSEELFLIMNSLNFEKVKMYGDNAFKFAMKNWSFAVVGNKIMKTIYN